MFDYPDDQMTVGDSAASEGTVQLVLIQHIEHITFRVWGNRWGQGEGS